MKKWCIALLVWGSVWVTRTQAQDVIFFPDALFPVTDLGISVPIPSSWTYRQADGVYFAPNDEAIDIASDGDPNTVPGNEVIQITVTPFDWLGISDDTTLEAIAPAVRDSLGVSSELDAFDTAILGRRAISWFGQVGDTAGIILTIWTQDRQVVVMSLTVPSVDMTTSYARTWGVVLGNIVFTDDPNLTATADSAYGFSMSYPTDWTILNLENQGLFGAFENASDAGIVASGTTGDMTGITLVTTIRAYDDVSFTEDSTSDDLLQILASGMSLNDLQYEGDFYVNSMAGVGVLGWLDNGRWLYTVATLDDQNRVIWFYMLSAPDEKALRDFIPSFLFMLNSIQPN